jgi:hypothetical protein
MYPRPFTVLMYTAYEWVVRSLRIGWRPVELFEETSTNAVDLWL